MISMDSPQGEPGVDVWAVRLAAPAAVSRAFRSVISLEEMSRVARQEYGLGGAVQHGASTLPDAAFGPDREARNNIARSVGRP